MNLPRLVLRSASGKGKSLPERPADANLRLDRKRDDCGTDPKCCTIPESSFQALQHIKNSASGPKSCTHHRYNRQVLEQYIPSFCTSLVLTVETDRPTAKPVASGTPSVAPFLKALFTSTVRDGLHFPKCHLGTPPSPCSQPVR